MQQQQQATLSSLLTGLDSYLWDSPAESPELTMDYYNNRAGRKSFKKLSWNLGSHIIVLFPGLDVDFKVFPFLWSGKMWLCPGLWIPPQVLSQRRFGGHGKPMGEGVRDGGGRGWWGSWEGEREYHGFIVVCFPTINDTGRGAEQLNIQTAQWGGEHWAAVEHGWRIPLIKPAERTPDFSTAPVWISLNPKVLCKEN